MARHLRWVPAYIGLGANLDDPLQQLRTALVSLAQVPDTRLVMVSPAYRSSPMGPQDQPEYINAVAGMLTSLEPGVLLDALQAIERGMGRVRGGERWGPRIIDLDLLVYGDTVVQNERLVLPHPGIHERGFVLYPLADIAPTLKVPGRGSVESLRAAVPADDLLRLEDSLTV
jgi:2-amino-4-hydroxy-6-hydroxymethyldihydropteridine diphosphokinase